MLFDVYMDISDGLIKHLGAPIEGHDVFVLDIDPHECLDLLIDSMESRGFTLHDLSSYTEFLKSSLCTRCHVTVIRCPHGFIENKFQLLHTADRMIRGNT